uniref:UmuC domain-containing protein n=1 Tax=Glossina brevipalpis TaxID=37001 RepID=A0A1A9W5P7_9MUSC
MKFKVFAGINEIKLKVICQLQVTSIVIMDFSSALNKSEPHQRTIIHLDMDCFYAQVEEIKNPSLCSQPLGVQQKNFVVTCNYKARSHGVKKLMLVADAKRLCPDLILVNGEDLTPYRQMSQKIYELLLNFTPSVEKLGLDENFMDVSLLVEKRKQQMGITCISDINLSQVEGFIYPADGMNLNSCCCGCAYSLTLGTQIAQEIRKDLHTKLGITCCAGISYNKLLAKLVGAQNKPNQQTVLVSSYAEQFMRNLGGLHRVTGIGQKTESLLLESGIANIEELQRCDMDILRKKFGYETAMKLKDLAFGRDTGTVRTTGKPKSIGLEDSCKPISVRNEVEERFRLLLMRLMEQQVAEDGRIPICIKVILRKYDAQKKSSHRETKQVNILPSLFKMTPCTDTGGAKVIFSEGAQEKLLKIIMRLFERVVDLTKPFNITLIGLAFSKFQQRKLGSSSIANFLIKKTDLEVQSITSLINTDFECNQGNNPLIHSSSNSSEAFRSSPTTFQPSDQFYRRRTMAASPIPMLVDNGSESAATNSDFSDFSETEVEPSPKKTRLGRLLINKRRCLGNSALSNDTTAADIASPSKLRVCDLRLNSRDSDRDIPISPNTNVSSQNTAFTNTSTSTSELLPDGHSRLSCAPQRHDRSEEFQLNDSQNVNRPNASSATAFTLPFSMKMDDNNSMDLPLPPQATSELRPDEPNKNDIESRISPITNESKSTENLLNIPCPAGVDPQVFNELPIDVQNELINSWRSSLAVAMSNGNISTLDTPKEASNADHRSVITQQQKSLGNSNTKTAVANAANGVQKNTLYRYFLRNK